MLFFPRFYSKHYLFGVNEYNELMTVLPPGDQMDPASHFSAKSTFCEAVELNDPSSPSGVLFLINAAMVGETTYGLPLFSCSSIEMISESRLTSKGLSWVYADVNLLVDQNSKSVHRLRKQLNDPKLTEDARSEIYERLEDPSLFRYFLVQIPTELSLQVSTLNFDEKFAQLRNDYPQRDDVPGSVNVAILTGSQITKDRKFLPYHFDRNQHPEQWESLNKQIWSNSEDLALIQPAIFYHLSADLVSKIPEEHGTEDWTDAKSMLLIVKDNGEGAKVHSVFAGVPPSRLIPESVEVEVSTDGEALLRASLIHTDKQSEDSEDHLNNSNDCVSLIDELNPGDMMDNDSSEVTQDGGFSNLDSDVYSDAVTIPDFINEHDFNSESEVTVYDKTIAKEETALVEDNLSLDKPMINSDKSHPLSDINTNDQYKFASSDVNVDGENCDIVTKHAETELTQEENFPTSGEMGSDAVDENGCISQENENNGHWWEDYLNKHHL